MTPRGAPGRPRRRPDADGRAMSGAGAELRALIGRPPLVLPGCADALTARIAAAAGFEALYATGAGIANAQLGQPDVGLHDDDGGREPGRADRRCRRGPGPGRHRHRVRERHQRAAGRAGLRAGRRRRRPDRGPGLPEAVRSLRPQGGRRRRRGLASCGRSSTRGPTRTSSSWPGPTRSRSRGRRRRRTGPRVRRRRRRRRVRRGAAVPRDARRATRTRPRPARRNMVEGGRTPLLSAAELGELGYAIVLFANTALRVAARAAPDALRELRRTGDAAPLIERMLGWDERQALVGLPEIEAFEARYRTDDATIGSNEPGSRHVD